MQCASKDDSASRALIAERNVLEMRINELEKRNVELEEQLHRGSDPLELRHQQLVEEMSLLQKKLQVLKVTEIS
jgi:hypothetical protein